MSPAPLLMVEDELRPGLSEGGAEMMRRVYEVDPVVCGFGEYLFLSKKRTSVVREWTVVLNNPAKVSGRGIGIFIAD